MFCSVSAVRKMDLRKGLFAFHDIDLNVFVCLKRDGVTAILLVRKKHV